MSRIAAVTVIIAGACLARAAAAEGSRVGNGPDRSNDQRFLDEALGVNELELQLGQLATERGTSPEVKTAARTMVEKHSALRKQLAGLSTAAGGSGEPRMTAEQQGTLAAMRSQGTASFDAAFKKTVDDGHVKELAMYRAEVPRASSPALRSLAEERVVALQRSLADAGRPASTSMQGTGSKRQEW